MKGLTKGSYSRSVRSLLKQNIDPDEYDSSFVLCVFVLVRLYYSKQTIEDRNQLNVLRKNHIFRVCCQVIIDVRVGAKKQGTCISVHRHSLG